MTFEEFRKTINRYFSIVDHVRLFQISGGEPLLHRDIAQMVEEALKYSNQFQTLMIFTNGTVPIQDDLFKIMKINKNKCEFYVSNYGLHTDKFVSFVTKLSENKIGHKIINYHGNEQYFGGWVDFGEYTKRNRTHDDLTKVFQRCANRKIGGCWNTKYGNMHWCLRSLRGVEQGLISAEEGTDYLNLFDNGISLQIQRETLKRIINTGYISACDYCSGDIGTTDTSKRHPAAEQMD